MGIDFMLSLLLLVSIVCSFGIPGRRLPAAAAMMGKGKVALRKSIETRHEIWVKVLLSSR